MSDGLMDYRNQRLTINFSASRLIMGVTDIDMVTLMVLSCGTLRTGVTIVLMLAIEQVVYQQKRIN